MIGNHDCQADARNRAQHGHADEAADGQPEFPPLDAIDATQVGDLDQADGRGDHDGCQRAAGQMLEQVRRRHQQQGDRERADDACQLGSGARGLGHRGA